MPYRFLVLEDPRVGMRDIDRMNPGGEGRIDVRARAVADHPGSAGIPGMPADKVPEGARVFFRENLDLPEIGTEFRSFDLP